MATAYLAALTQVYINSAFITSVTAVIDTYYVADTATAPVAITLPQGVPSGHWIVVQNAPNNGPQMGGGTVGNNVTVQAGGAETLEGSATDIVVPPVSTVTAAAHKYFPVGTSSGSSGFGAGWVVL